MSYWRNLTTKIYNSLRSTGSSVSLNQIPSNKYNVRPVKTAEELINEVKPVEVTSNTVGCDGGNGPLGHPMVYINLDSHEPQPCGYCGIRFVQKKGHHHH
ncbi:putative NADH dehydrogenase [Tieghemostelium lacteum]|uniref:Putative NADH dehydrogenase n=1 Tax=Tieghemostelium lacteum TaxID=361077 RepID=A0A152A284_TIELA|nr:putative NADH dehydrogenase [Tieghemostelium lacteum]|eukprot:KYR00314.1 putative NADH dehydrogenase [Tieghemostelium lacteum]